jgi:hypothetical protein
MNGPPVNQPPMTPQRPLSEREARVNLAFGVLQAVKVDEHEEEAEVLALRAACAKTIREFLESTAPDAAVEAAWKNAAATK